MANLPIKNCIEHWEGELFHHRFLMSIATAVIVEATVAHLKELKLIKDKVEEAKQNGGK